MIEAIGLPSTFRAAVEEVAFTGRGCVSAMPRNLCVTRPAYSQKELDILGSRNARPEDFREVIRMLESGGFAVENAVSAVVPMEDAGRMLAEWSDSPGRFTKIMVAVG